MPLKHDKASHEMMMISKPDQPTNPKFLRVAIIGTPNSGKSTLTNAILGTRVCSVSRKVHTTRRNSLAVITRGNTQVVFMDTPGMIHHKKGRRHNVSRSLLVDAKNSLYEVDLVAVLVDVANKHTRHELDQEILLQLHQHPELKSILVLNKTDALRSREVLFKIVADLSEGVIGGAPLDRRQRQPPPDKQVKQSHTDIQETRVTEEDSDVEHYGDIEIDEKYENIPTDVQSSEGCETRTMLYRDDNTHEKSSINDNLDCDHSNLAHQRQDERTDMLNKYVQHLDMFDELTVSEESMQQKETEQAERRELLEKVRGMKGWPGFDQVFAISALNGTGVDDLKNYFFEATKPGLWEFHSDVVSNLSPEEIVNDAIWEELLNVLPKEVPYKVNQFNELITIGDTDELIIFQTLECYSKNHERMLESSLKRIVRQARQNLMNAFHAEVDLRIAVRRKAKSFALQVF